MDSYLTNLSNLLFCAVCRTGLVTSTWIAPSIFYISIFQRLLTRFRNEGFCTICNILVYGETFLGGYILFWAVERFESKSVMDLVDLLMLWVGVPQSSVLGPLLFVAYTADIKNTTTSPFAMFADHIKLCSSCANYSSLERETETRLFHWQLTSFMYGLARRLGCCCTSNLSWTEDVQRVASKANKMLFLLSQTFSKASH